MARDLREIQGLHPRDAKGFKETSRRQKYDGGDRKDRKRDPSERFFLRMPADTGPPDGDPRGRAGGASDGPKVPEGRTGPLKQEAPALVAQDHPCRIGGRISLSGGLLGVAENIGLGNHGGVYALVRL